MHNQGDGFYGNYQGLFSSIGGWFGGWGQSAIMHPDYWTRQLAMLAPQQYLNAGFTPTAQEWARFAAGAANSLQTPLSKAQAYAAQVRARNPQMQIKKLP